VPLPAELAATKRGRGRRMSGTEAGTTDRSG